MADAAYIVAATRTAGGRKGGKLAGWHPIDLGAAVLDSVLDRTGVDPAGGAGSCSEVISKYSASPCSPSSRPTPDAR